ncbi:MAG: prepilin peptidase [Alphaproteobacteria bacterium]|nr:MAG: prepilin peptidase [Alphaproteobacteria bacterium]
MTDLLRYHWVLLLVAAPCVGSFIGVVVARLPQGRPFGFVRSACPACDHVLSWADLVPILGWVMRRGRCGYCGAAISPAYPAVELAALGIAVWSLAVMPGWLAWAGSGFGWTLLTLAWIDARHLVLPDELTLPLVPAGLAVAWAVDPGRLGDHVIGTVGGFAAIWALRWLYGRLRGREGIGLGDAKLLAAGGAWVGWQGLAGGLLIAALAALLAHALRARLRGERLGGRELPFGPYLAAGLWITWLYGPLTVG